jgi:hypothetical protein
MDYHRAAYVHHTAKASAYERAGYDRKSAMHRERALVHRMHFGGPGDESPEAKKQRIQETVLNAAGHAFTAVGLNRAAMTGLKNAAPYLTETLGEYAQPALALAAAGCIGYGCYKSFRETENTNKKRPRTG